MGVFDNTETNQSTNTNTEGNNQQSQTTESFVNKLVETKGENFKDPEVIAKSKLEADAFIQDLERQNKELREDLTKQDYSKELLTQLQQQATSTANVNTGESNSNNNNGSTSTGDDTKSLVGEEVDLESLINKTLTDRDKAAKETANLQIVDSKLTELFGTEAESKVEQKGAELGLTKEYLKSMAADSPQAFFTLIGEANAKVVNPVTRSTINTAGDFTNQTSDRDYNYYSKIRKENPSVYFSPKVQREMADDATRLGGKFYT